jgi:hypothetical protein
VSGGQRREAARSDEGDGALILGELSLALWLVVKGVRVEAAEPADRPVAPSV